MSAHSPPTHGLDLPAPYDAGHLFAFLATRAIPGVEEVEQIDGHWRYRRTLRLAEAPATITIETDGRAAAVSATEPASISGGSLEAIARRILDLTTDPAEVDAALMTHDELAPLVARRPGLRVPGAADAFELVVRAIVGQQISVPLASAACGRIAEQYGDQLTAAADGPKRLFPTPAQLADAEPKDLRMPQRRATAIITLAQQVAEGRLDLAQPSANVRRQLQGFPGIGPWTAGYVAMRACADRDVLLDGDLIVRRSADALGLPASARALSAYAERFSPWRSYVTMHLWAAYHPG